MFESQNARRQLVPAAYKYRFQVSPLQTAPVLQCMARTCCCCICRSLTCPACCLSLLADVQVCLQLWYLLPVALLTERLSRQHKSELLDDGMSIHKSTGMICLNRCAASAALRPSLELVRMLASCQPNNHTLNAWPSVVAASSWRTFLEHTAAHSAAMHSTVCRQFKSTVCAASLPACRLAPAWPSGFRLANRDCTRDPRSTSQRLSCHAWPCHPLISSLSCISSCFIQLCAFASSRRPSYMSQ